MRTREWVTIESEDWERCDLLLKGHVPLSQLITKDTNCPAVYMHELFYVPIVTPVDLYFFLVVATTRYCSGGERILVVIFGVSVKPGTPPEQPGTLLNTKSSGQRSDRSRID